MASKRRTMETPNDFLMWFFYLPLTTWYRLTRRVWFYEVVFVTIHGGLITARGGFVTYLWQRFTPWLVIRVLMEQNNDTLGVESTRTQYVGWWWPTYQGELMEQEEFYKKILGSRTIPKGQ
jgi:hypothetical protein